MLLGKHVQGLYVVDSSSLNAGSVKPECINTRCHSALVENPKNKVGIDLWHKRWGHAPLHTLKQLNNLNFCVDNVNFDHKHYIVCPLAKQTRTLFPLSTSQSDACFHILHDDVWGPYKVSTYDGMSILGVPGYFC